MRWLESDVMKERIARRIPDIRLSVALGRRRFRPATIATILGALAIVLFELQTSTMQSFVLSQWARHMQFAVEAGPAGTLIFPQKGPFDTRLGYTRLPDYISALTRKQFVVEQQARTSGSLQMFQQIGGFAPYREKTSSGLTILAAGNRPYFDFRQPRNIYPSLAAVPAPVAASLMFVENRDLLDPEHPIRNPAVDWNRFGLALFEFATHGGGGASPGGSTIATQMEKLRHSPGGRTSGPADKLRQMLSASVRAYSNGRDTTAFRQEVIVDALNLMPLAGFRNHGEVIGVGDGLVLWFGADFAEVNRELSAPARTDDELRRKGLALKEVLSLIISQRRPGYYLGKGRDDLERLTESYLRLMAAQGVLDARLAEAAARARLQFNAVPPVPAALPPATAKAATATRSELLRLLGGASFYDLQRLDLTAETTLNLEAERQATEILRSLRNPENLHALGLDGFGLSSPEKAARVNYSFTLYERGPATNYLRIQTDSLDQPLDVNVGTKLELGSTAKVRTLISYLEIIAALYDEHRRDPAPKLQAMAANGDPLTAWVAGQLLETGDKGLPALLDAAMEKRYSGGTGERFFTAGGMHRFANFNRHEGGFMSVATGLEKSVNLVYIRIMRDIEDYHIARIPGATGIFDNPDHPARKTYLRQFIDMEGRQYLARFLPDYRNLDRAGILAHIAERAKFLPPRLAAAYRTVRPQAPFTEFASFINRWAVPKVADEEAMQKLYTTYAPQRLNLADRSYISRIHPLELWLAGYLYDRPTAPWRDIVAAGAGVRQESYKWLLKPSRFHAQNLRIKTMLEREVFVTIHKDWQRFGYPFDTLVPSYATAIGVSGDRPDALAELMGIISSGGYRRPLVRIARLRFAAGTPYETAMKAAPAPGRLVLRPEIANVVRRGLVDVVQNGTARRAYDAVTGPDGKPLVIGGKTGTGDNRSGSTAKSRTATFAFFIGDRFFGTVTAFVEGPEADQYKFTSALAAQLFKVHAPVIERLMGRKPGVVALARADPPANLSRH